jgi:hypothetical protein
MPGHAAAVQLSAGDMRPGAQAGQAEGARHSYVYTFTRTLRV